MKKFVASSLLVLLLCFCLLPSFEFPGGPENYVRVVKQVEIKGEVIRPGVYTVQWDASVADVIKEAGGANDQADLSSLSLSMTIENEGVIVVPKKVDKKKISINTATIEELDTLEGVGPAIAQRIIDYRNKKPFMTLEELKEVKGIGDKLFAKIKDNISL